MDRDGNRSRPSAQKGVLLVFTALLLPVVFACAGLVMKSGWMISEAGTHRSIF